MDWFCGPFGELRPLVVFEAVNGHTKLNILVLTLLEIVEHLSDHVGKEFALDVVVRLQEDLS